MIGVLFCNIGILIAKKKKKGVRHNYKLTWKTRLESAREYKTPKLKTLDPNPSSLSPLPSALDTNTNSAWKHDWSVQENMQETQN